MSVLWGIDHSQVQCQGGTHADAVQPLVGLAEGKEVSDRKHRQKALQQYFGRDVCECSSWSWMGHLGWEVARCYRVNLMIMQMCDT